MRRVLAAPDKFRGSATSTEVAAAIAAGAVEAHWHCTQIPMADGGEGTLDAFGGANRATWVTGPLGRPVYARWRLGPDGTAVIESASASGLALLGGAEHNDPINATSRGTGELIVDAIAQGGRRIIVGLGGSASTDGGWGAVETLKDHRAISSEQGVEILVACDVETGFSDAPQLFGPQKGASPQDVRQLRGRLRRLSDAYQSDFGVDVARIPGAGAAGGLAGGLAALGARLVPGFQLIAEHAGLEEAARSADLIVTGEGKLDASSFKGKVVGGVAEVAQRAGIPLFVVAGSVEQNVAEKVRAFSLLKEYGQQLAWEDPAACIQRIVSRELTALGLPSGRARRATRGARGRAE